MSSFTSNKHDLLMVGMSSITYRIGKKVRKQCHVLPDDTGITEQNLDACNTEADVYFILGSHPLIVSCLSVGPSKEYVELEYCVNGNLNEYINKNRSNMTEADIERCAVQMIESVAYIHSRGVRHSDLRLDQWLVDEAGNARLSDFNASGFDDQPILGLKGKSARGLESASHCLPRPHEVDSTVVSDLFALGSSLYELVTGQQPYQGISDDMIELLFASGNFPNTEGLLFGDEISACWNQKFKCARDILDAANNRRKRTGL